MHHMAIVDVVVPIEVHVVGLAHVVAVVVRPGVSKVFSYFLESANVHESVLKLFKHALELIKVLNYVLSLC